MAIVNIRVDDRLIHGQVAAVWSLITQATRIMVIDDEVVKDAVNKGALQMACPQRCKLSILSVERAAINLNTDKYDADRLFIVVKGPKTLKDLYDAGFKFDTVNVGNMGGKTNTTMVKKAVSVSENDIENFKYLAANGVKVTAQMVPTDEVLDLISLFK